MRFYQIIFFKFQQIVVILKIIYTRQLNVPVDDIS